MPIFMDRHDVSEEVTAEIVAALHQADLKIQDKYNCRGLTYWFDETRKTAFCLVEAPNEQAIKNMHKDAHGEVPHQIIEVDKHIVASFLGRIEDPQKASNTTLNIINDPAFRTILYIEICPSTWYGTIKQDFLSIVLEVGSILISFEGRLVSKNSRYVLASFKSVSNAVHGALEIKSRFQAYLVDNNLVELKLNIGMYSGVPVSHSKGFFKETITMAKRFSLISEDKLTVSSEVKNLYESELLERTGLSSEIRVVTPNQEDFVRRYFEYLESQWENPALNLSGFCLNLGLSKSQLYRNIIAITGKSPNIFLKEYRLFKALSLLEQNNLTVADIAYKTGFNSAAYFSKCFFNLFGIVPSVFQKQESLQN